MSQSLLNRTSSYASCYSAVASTMPMSSMIRHGSIENLLHGHSKSNPANIHVIVRKNFEPFAQAHVSVTKGNKKEKKTPCVFMKNICRNYAHMF
jgi:hypothetical protein